MTTEPEDDAPETEAEPEKAPKKRTRRNKPFPGISFGEALVLPEAIQTHGAGQRIRRLTLFEKLERSPDSGPTRKLITGSNQYGLTSGAYSAEFLDLTEKGRIATDPAGNDASKIRARIDLAILSIEPFKRIYDRYANNRLPTAEVIRDAFVEDGIDSDLANEGVETFLANARELGLIRTIGGAEHLVSTDAVVEAASPSVLASNPTPDHQPQSPGASGRDNTSASASPFSDDYSKTCFIISPIGQVDSEERQHADLVLGSLLSPALQELGLNPVRADQIAQPGLITSQVIEHIAKSALVIADLSFANPNVYYELALRQAVRKPMVQIIRTVDPLPFDVGQFRTYVIDMTNIYTLVPQLQLHQKEITRQCRSALEDGAAAESQLSQFFPSFWEHIGK